MKLAVLQAVLAARKSKTPLAVVTRLADGAQALVWRDRAEGALTLGDAALVEIRDRLRSDRSGTIADGSLFVQVNSPPLRLIIVGAVHISQTLAPMAAIARPTSGPSTHRAIRRTAVAQICAFANCDRAQPAVIKPLSAVVNIS